MQKDLEEKKRLKLIDLYKHCNRISVQKICEKTVDRMLP
jgi:hypothetical protein